MKTTTILIFSMLFITSAYAQKRELGMAIDKWHTAAAEADFDTYFNLMTSNAVFVGSDASEVWNYEEFKSFSKPYFDAGKAWTFESVNRNIYQDKAGNTAWFDEVLKSDHMGLCRGSGVLQKTNGEWKIRHYVLSLAVPNALVDELVQQKSELDRVYLESQP